MSPESRAADRGAGRRALGELAAECARRRGRAPSSPPISPTPTASSRRPAATWRGPRSTPAWSTGSATGSPSAGGWPSLPAPISDERVPGSYRAVHLDAWAADNPASDTSGQIGVLTVAGDDRRRPRRAGHAPAPRRSSPIWSGACASGRLRALVVRVDSPGGSTFASERIRRAIEQVRARGIPVVISMGNVAASGGYWIATAGDTIFAEPATITGSIGVFGILPSFEGALQRLGVGADGVRTTPLSGEPDILRGPSPQADQLLQTGRREHLSPLRRAGRARAAAAAAPGARDRAGPGLGRRLGAPARPGRPVRHARRRGRRGGAARESGRRRGARRLPRARARLLGERLPGRRRGRGRAASRRRAASPGWRGGRRR